MKAFFLAALVAGACIASAANTCRAADKDELQGEWVATSYEINGKPAPQPQFELFMALCPDDFHGLRWRFELILGRNCFVGILTRSHAGPLRRNFGARLCRPRPAAARRGVLGPWKFPRAAAGLRHSRAPSHS